jgi:NAD(P)-dependent dehydrogenase (short-subunit alcohol dehydrogenase family)
MNSGWIAVTGASRGIGAAIAADLERRGARVASLSRSGKTAAGTAFACDVTDEAALARLFGELAADGGLTGLVNNAGKHESCSSASLPTAQYEEIMRLNATAVFAASRIAYPSLKASGGGMIVNIGSFFDKLGIPENLAYAASKAAVGAITRCLAAEWARDGIKVVNVAPGYVETDLNRDFLTRESVKAWLGKRVPVQRAGEPEEIGRLVGALFEENIPYLTGETIYVDGGQGMYHA